MVVVIATTQSSTLELFSGNVRIFDKDMTLQEINSLKEKLSKAYIYALIAKLNYAAEEFGKDIDSCGYDFRVVNQTLGLKRTAASELCEIKIQIKGVSVSSSSMLQDKGVSFRYKLNSDLPRWGTSCFLVVMVIPEEENLNNWIILSEEEIILKKCAYYIEVPREGLAIGFVEIPKKNILTVDNFKRFFGAISKDDY